MLSLHSKDPENESNSQLKEKLSSRYQHQFGVGDDQHWVGLVVDHVAAHMIHEAEATREVEVEAATQVEVDLDLIRTNIPKMIATQMINDQEEDDQEAEEVLIEDQLDLVDQDDPDTLRLIQENQDRDQI
jgi:hypothetical protein